MQPQSNNSASKKQYNPQQQQQQQQHHNQQPKQQQLPASTATTNATGNQPQLKIVKSRKPLCQYKFYLDICDHQLTKRIEDQIKLLGGVQEFFLNTSVTHFITDKPAQTQQQQLNTNTSQPGTPQTPATPGTPQTPYSLETNDATPIAAHKRTRTSRADAILNRARRQSSTATVLTRTPTSTAVRASTKDLPANAVASASTLPYIVWQTEYALRFFKKVQIELRQYLEPPKDKHKSTNSSCAKPKLVDPIVLKGNFIKIEPFKRNYRPYYQLFKKPIEWPKIELRRDDGAFRLSPKKHYDEQYLPKAAAHTASNLEPKTKMTRKSRSRSSQHRPLPATVQALKKQSIDGSPKASAGMQRHSKLPACNKDIKESSDKQCGVCEICKIEYDTLSIHLKSKDHEFFAKNAQNFIALDTLINASADVSKFLEDNKKMELEEMEVDEETNTEASAMDPLNNATPTMGLTNEKRRSSGVYKTPSPTLREKSKRITKGKHSSEKFQKTDFTTPANTAQTTATTTKSNKTSPTKSNQTAQRSRSPEKRQTSSGIAEMPATEARKTVASTGNVRKKTSSVLPLSPPIRPMLPQSPLYKVVETPEMRTPKRRIRLGGGDDLGQMHDSPSLIVKFQKVRSTELERLNGEAESFMFRKHAISSELPTDQDRQTTSDNVPAGSISSGSLDSTSESHDMLDIENLQQPLPQKAIAKAKRRKIAAALCKQSFPNAPIQPEIQMNARTASTNKRLSNTATTSSSSSASSFALPEATRKSSRTATAIVTAATTSSLLQAAVDAARHNGRKRCALPKSNAANEQTALAKLHAVCEAQSVGRTRRAIVKLEDRMGDAPTKTQTQLTTTITTTMSPRIKIKLERHTPIPQPPTVDTPQLAVADHELDLLDFEVFDDDEDIDNDDVNDEDFGVRKRKRKPTMKATAAAATTNISSGRRTAPGGSRRGNRSAWYTATEVKREQLTEPEMEDEENSMVDSAAGDNTEDDDDEKAALAAMAAGEHSVNEQDRLPEAKPKTANGKRRRRGPRWCIKRKKRALRWVKVKTVPAKRKRARHNDKRVTAATEEAKDTSAIASTKPSPAASTPPRKSQAAKEQNSPTTAVATTPGKLKSTNAIGQPGTLHSFDYTKSEHINKLQYSFERLPEADHWYRVFARQDACAEKYYEYFGRTQYRKLPYELGPIPFDSTLKGVHCKFCTQPANSDMLDTSAVDAATKTDDATTMASIGQHEAAAGTSAYLHKHKKLHLLQRYRKEQQELLQKQQQQQQQLESEQSVAQLEPCKAEINPAAEGTTATTTRVSSKASTPDLENAHELGPRKRAGSTHSTASSCASSSATLNKKPFRNKHLNKAVFLNLELPPRKSPREHASTLALVSCIIKQRQDSLSKNNSETDEPPTTPTTPTMHMKPIKAELEADADYANQLNGVLEAAVDGPAAANDCQVKQELETREQMAMVAQREKTPEPAEEPQQQPAAACSPRTTRSTAATPIEEMRFATEISETVKRMRRGQNKYDHSPPFMPQQHTPSVPPKPASTQTTPRKRGRPPKDKTAAVAKLSMSILPYKRRDGGSGSGSLPTELRELSSSQRSNTPNSNRSSAMLQRSLHANNRRGRPTMLHKMAAYNNAHSSNYALSPAIRKIGSKKGITEFEMDTAALKALEIATQHTNVAHLEWEIDKYLQLACKDYDIKLDAAGVDEQDVAITANDDPAVSTAAPLELAAEQQLPAAIEHTPPTTDYFSSEFDLCDLLEASTQFTGACAAYGAQPEGKRRAYSVYSAAAFENYFRKRRSNKKNRTGWPTTQRRRVGTHDKRKTRYNNAAIDESKKQSDDKVAEAEPAPAAARLNVSTAAAAAAKSKRESGVITPPDSEIERGSAKTSASLENAEEYEGAESTEMDAAESVHDEEDDGEEDEADGAEADEEEEEEEVFADAEAGGDDDDIDGDVDAETMADSVDETCTQDMGAEADEDDDEEEDDLVQAERLLIKTEEEQGNGNDDDEEEDDEDADEAHEHDANDDEDEDDDGHDEDEYERATLHSEDSKAQEQRDAEDEADDDDDDETKFKLAAEHAPANGEQVHDANAALDDDDEEPEIAQVTANRNSFMAAFAASTASGTGKASQKRARHARSQQSTTANNAANSSLSPEQKLNHSNLLAVPALGHSVTSTPTNQLLRALRRTPQLNGSLGSCISPSEKAGDNSDIFTVSSDGLDTDLDLSNQHAQLRTTSGILTGIDDEAANECPHHNNHSSTSATANGSTATTPKRRLDITKYAPKTATSSCAAEAATAAVKSLAISQFLKKEVRVTCRRIRAPFRRFRFRR